MSDRSVADVAAVLSAFAAGWKALDGEAVAATFESSVTVIGTDPGEYTVGSDTYLAGWHEGGYPVQAAEFDWEVDPVISVQGPVAWAHGIIRYDMATKDGTRHRGRMWISTTLRLTGRWRIAHLHASYT